MSYLNESLGYMAEKNADIRTATDIKWSTSRLCLIAASFRKLDRENNEFAELVFFPEDQSPPTALKYPEHIFFKANGERAHF